MPNAPSPSNSSEFFSKIKILIPLGRSSCSASLHQGKGFCSEKRTSSDSLLGFHITILLHLEQMSTMCQACGIELAAPAIVFYCKICQLAFCQECEKSGPSTLIGEHENWCCKSCSEKKEASGVDSISPYTTPVLSPSNSTTSYHIYNCSSDDTPVDTNSQIRGYDAEDLDTGQKLSVVGLAEHSEKQEDGIISGGSSIRRHISSGVVSFPKTMEEAYSSNSVTLDIPQDGNGTTRTSIKFENGVLGDVQSVRVQDDSDGPEIAIDNTPYLANIDTDPLIWIPPEPEDMEDEIMSVTNNEDDDDEYNDGTEWGQPSSLNCLSEDGKSYGDKEERQKVMMETMIGQLNILVSRFLTSEGIPVPHGEDAESWHDIVASLSREAALLVKPDASEGRAMDPGSYVKIKCIASGTRSQSQVINGLVFKKNTAHKHMPTKFKNPRILLLKGALGHSAAGLSSLASMEEEKDYLKSITEMAESCHPNLVLVEKSVSRDIQESLVAKGITLVYDMKLPRLKRIAQCIDSQIISATDILTKPKLKQCGSFHIEKFVEEHNSSIEGGKRPNKTLMFLEGCPKPLGCTVLLKGAHIDELKKIKHLMQYTVFAAYHLILENSFFADQRAVFPEMNGLRYTPIDKQIPAVFHEAAPKSIIYDAEGSVKVVSQAHPSDDLDFDGPLENSAPQLNSDPEAERCLDSPLLNGDSTSTGDITFAEDKAIANNHFHDEPNIYDAFRSDASGRHRLPGQRLSSSVSAYFEKFLGDSLLPRASESISSYFNFRGKEGDQNSDVPVSVSLEAPDPATEENDKITVEKVDVPCNGEEAEVVPNIVENIGQNGDDANDKVQTCNGDKSAVVSDIIENIGQHGDDANDKVETCNGEQTVVVSDIIENIGQHSNHANDKVHIQRLDDVESVLEPQNILVLFSSRCVTKQLVCEQSHLSRIKYYGNFDMTLGRLLRDILLSQKHTCSSCGEPPESHVYCYTHQNGNLTVLVKRLPQELILPGEAEEKIWMWTRCLKCEHGSEFSKSIRRVEMSSAARGLSFGKFLDLSFSSHSASSRLSICGHSLLRDSLRFFGLGSRVAMFRYSPVEIYTVYKPPPVMEFYSPTGQEWIKKETNDVLVKVDLFFTEVANMLQKLKPTYASSFLAKPPNSPGSVIKFADVEEMLMREKTEFKGVLDAMNQCMKPGKTGHEILGLRWLKQELLLELYIWDRRLHSIQLCSKESDTSVNANNLERPHVENGLVPPGNKQVEENMTENIGTEIEDTIQIPIDPEEREGPERTISETEVEIECFGVSDETCNQSNDSPDVSIDAVECLSRENSAPLMSEDHLTPVIGQDCNNRPSDHSSLLTDNIEKGKVPSLDHMKASLDHMKADTLVPPTGALLASSEEGADLKIKPVGGETSSQNQHLDVSQKPPRYEDSESWIWVPFPELRVACRKDLNGGSLHKFGFINSYNPTYLSATHKLIAQESNSMHFLVGHSGDIVSACEDDISSIIACALTLFEDLYWLNNTTDGESKGEPDRRINTTRSLTSEALVASSHWSSSESDGMHSSQSLSSFSTEELSTSASDFSSFVDRSIASDLHPEIPVGSAKVPGKGKCSVVCIHANQFYALRRRCCPSETAYISSLSHCRKWDAQGGKSKAFFAKSLDDRFIIKQIKKTELESFLKFAPDYFKHISVSLDSGSQTCLAKILGIYQVKQNKGGKEIKIDLMVMENLLYGRNISRIYDLKGALFSRYMLDSKDPECVLLDENFIVDMHASPIYIGGKTKHLFQRAIWNDTSFLTSINVMDYSLLVGVDKRRHELVFGIIDYLRQYTWDKQLETWVKASLVVPKNLLPTVVSPKEYKKRFRKFMAKYFLTVPDSWSSERCAGLCKFCTDDIC